MRKIQVPSFILGLVCFLCLNGGAEPGGVGQQTTEPPTTTLRVATHLVLLDVVVTDKAGHGIRDLRSDEFTIQEDGKPQKIVFLTPPDAGTRVQAPAALPAGIYSNRPQYRLPGGEATVILLDAANTPYQDQLYARQEMLRFVKEQYKMGQRVAIFALTDKLSLVQDFNGDARVLLQSLERLKPHEEFSLAVTNSNPPLPEGTGVNAQAMLASVNAMRAFQQAQVQYSIDRRVEVTLEAMRSITRILGGIPGRKNVIWLAGGYPFNLIPELGSLGAGANDLIQAEHGAGGVPGGRPIRSHPRKNCSTRTEFGKPRRKCRLRKSQSIRWM